MMLLLYFFGGLFSIALFIILGELGCGWFPKSRLSKWWRENFIFECQECD